MEKPYRGELVPTYLWENLVRSSPKESVPDLSYLVVIWGIIFALWFSTHTVFTGMLYDDPG